MKKEDFYKEFGHVKVTFVRYRRFTFTYMATLPDGRMLVCSYGSTADDIYDHEVTSDGEETVLSLQPETGDILDKNGVEIDSFYDFS